MMQGNFTSRFFCFDSCLVLYVISLICICIQYFIMLCIYMYILYIVFVFVSLVYLMDYVYTDTAIRYLPLVFPVLLFLPAVPQFVRTRYNRSVDDFRNGASTA